MLTVLNPPARFRSNSEEKVYLANRSLFSYPDPSICYKQFLTWSPYLYRLLCRNCAAASVVEPFHFDLSPVLVKMAAPALAL